MYKNMKFVVQAPMRAPMLPILKYCTRTEIWRFIAMLLQMENPTENNVSSTKC